MHQCAILLPFLFFCNFNFHTHIIHQYFQAKPEKIQVKRFPLRPGSSIVNFFIGFVGGSSFMGVGSIFRIRARLDFLILDSLVVRLLRGKSLR